jgi:hypothetical protein
MKRHGDGLFFFLTLAALWSQSTLSWWLFFLFLGLGMLSNLALWVLEVRARRLRAALAIKRLDQLVADVLGDG